MLLNKGAPYCFCSKIMSKDNERRRGQNDRQELTRYNCISSQVEVFENLILLLLDSYSHWDTILKGLYNDSKKTNPYPENSPSSLHSAAIDLNLAENYSQPYSNFDGMVKADLRNFFKII